MVDFRYYTDTYIGEPVAETEFPRMEAKAARLITQLTHGRATEATLNALPEEAQTAVKNAVCAQIEYYSVLGTEIAVTGEETTGFTVGKVSIHASSRSSAVSGAPAMVCPAAIAALEQTGLLNPQVGTIDSASVFWPWR